MKTNRLSILVILLLCFPIFLAITQTATAQVAVAGVSKSETFDYNYNLTWTSTNPSATPPSDVIEYSNVEKTQFRITDVSGSVMTVDFTSYFKNGSQSVQTGTINIASGIVTVPYGSLIIGANLTKNQQIYPNGGHQIITDTVMRSYPSGQRETNVVSGEDSSQKTAVYYDKIKGIAVDYSYATYETSGDFNTTTIESMTNTNSAVWAVTPTSSASPTPTPTSSVTNPTVTPTPSATTTSHTPSPSVTIKPNPTSNSGANTLTSSPEPATGTPQQPTTLIIIVVVIVIVIALGIATIALRKKKKPLSESEQIIQSLK
jgi:hypothetical protein